MVMRWSSKFFGVAGVLVAAPFLSAAEPPGDTVTLQATVEASADGQSGPTPLRVTVLDENGQKVTVNGGATADIKTFTIRLVGDGNGVAVVSADAPGAEARKVPFIGVATSPLAPQVRAQTNLPEDVGLTVDVVAAGSPAAKAGLKPYDILAKYDDQLVCAAVQLSALVKRTGTGKTATLAVLRGGKEMQVEVIVGEHAAEATLQASDLNLTMLADVASSGGLGIVAGQLLDPEILKLLEQQGVTAGRAVVTQPQAGSPLGMPLPVLPQPALNQFVPPTAAQQSTIQKNQRFLLVNPTTQSQSQSVSIVKNDEGQIEIREVNGQRTVTILDTAGAQQFTGPFNNDDDRARIPEALRRRLEQAEASARPRAAAAAAGGVAPAPAAGAPTAGRPE